MRKITLLIASIALVGLGDVYDSICSYVTIYGYSNYGETQKRTLEQPDITGLQTLYGM